MDLRQLQYLVAVSETGGFRPAARRLYVAQPSISSALRALEGELGVTLIQRTSRGVEMTPAGEELVSQARELIAGFASAREAVQRIGREDARVLRVGLVTGIISAGELVPPIITAFSEARPDLRLEITEVSFSDQVTPLLDEVVDVMIVRGPLTYGPLADRALAMVPIAEEPRALLVAASHQLADEPYVQAEDILDLPMLPLAAPDTWSGFWQLDDLRGTSRTDEGVRPVCTVADVQIAVAMSGVVVTTPGSVVRFQPNPLIRAVPIKGAPRSVIGVARRRRDTRPRILQFVATAQSAAKEYLHLMPDAVLPS
jgi:DNA-binding transcriptional LysR family regulator